MKNNLFLIFGLIVSLLWACRENDNYLYDSTDNIYFNFEDTASSRITYSFANTPDVVLDTFFVPVRISGNRVDRVRLFKLAIVTEETTAQVEKHYQALNDFYEIAVDSGTCKVPVVIYNKDPEMDDSTFVITLVLQPTADFLIDLTYIPKVRIAFSNRLEEPAWWKYWMSNLGTYSRVKHQLFLIASGTTELVDMSDPNGYMQIPKTLFHLDQYKAFLTDPFAWVGKNEEYALTESENEEYHFYLKSAPEKVTILKKDPALGVYRFIDENGQFIS